MATDIHSRAHVLGRLFHRCLPEEFPKVLKDRFTLQWIPDREPELQYRRVWFNADAFLVIIKDGICIYTPFYDFRFV